VEAERSRDLYEVIPAYAPPPLVPLPAVGDLSAFEPFGLQPGRLTGGLVRAAMAVTGFTAFQRRLPETIETLLRTVNIRGPALYAPAVSATLAFADDARDLDPFQRAATLLLATRALRDDVFSGALPPDEYRGRPQEMGQYPNFFGTSVVLDGPEPRLFKTALTSQVTVIIGGRFHLLSLSGLQAGAEAAQLADALRALAEAAPPGGDSPGLLTAASDLTQRRLFAQLRRRPTNAHALARLRHSLVTLCLDLDRTPASPAEAAFLAHSANPDNRWFHASLQLVVFGNSRAAAICNFSAYLDGNTMMRGGAEIQRRAAAWRIDPPATNVPAPPTPTALAWELEPEWRTAAERDWQLLKDDQPATFESRDFGRALCDARGLDAVPAFVVALQHAVRRLTGRTPGITQFLAMSRYRCTDLVTARVTTPEVCRLVEALEAPASAEGAGRLSELLQEAIHSQEQACRRARRHLPLDDILTLFILTRRGLQRRWAVGVAALTAMALRATGKLKPIPREILISHPGCFAEVPVVGRPGARLPYVNDFGLHYQVWPDRTVYTLMPGLGWKIPNPQLAAELNASLARVAAVIASRPASSSPAAG